MSATGVLNVAETVAALKNSGYENEEGAIRAVLFRNATSTLDGLAVAKYQIGRASPRVVNRDDDEESETFGQLSADISQ